MSTILGMLAMAFLVASFNLFLVADSKTDPSAWIIGGIILFLLCLLCVFDTIRLIRKENEDRREDREEDRKELRQLATALINEIKGLRKDIKK